MMATTIISGNVSSCAKKFVVSLKQIALKSTISSLKPAAAELNLTDYEREIKRKYELMDLVNKRIYSTKNHLAFVLKQRFDKDMQPRYYTPLKKVR